ncbi:hypothetical protein [Burkholderia seminalis]|uniref:hypothetical protein n=1 Tax=Burkholderia seminalis TaxID=488731 RepID=UPI000F5B27C0|nr:hypothetical protein [Burkholderia seminalis]
MNNVKHTAGPWHFNAEMGQIDAPFSMPIAFLLSGNEADGLVLGAALDAVDVLEIIHDADEACRRDGLKPLPSMIRAAIDAVLIKAGRKQLERPTGGA